MVRNYHTKHPVAFDIHDIVYTLIKYHTEKYKSTIHEHPVKHYCLV